MFWKKSEIPKENQKSEVFNGNLVDNLIQTMNFKIQTYDMIKRSIEEMDRDLLPSMPEEHLIICKNQLENQIQVLINNFDCNQDYYLCKNANDLALSIEHWLQDKQQSEKKE